MWYFLIWFLIILVIWFLVFKYFGSNNNDSDKSDDNK